MRMLWLAPVVIGALLLWLGKRLTASTWREMWEAFLSVLFGVPECEGCGCRTRELYRCDTCGGVFCADCYDLGVLQCHGCYEEAGTTDAHR